MEYGIEVPPFESHHICFCVNKNANAFFFEKMVIGGNGHN